MSSNNETRSDYTGPVKAIGDGEVLGVLPQLPQPRADVETTYLLPKWLYIRDTSDRYLTVRPGPVYGTATLRSGDYDRDSIFQAVQKGNGWWRIIGNNGNSLMRYYSGWLSCDGTEGNGTLLLQKFITSADGSIYLTDNAAPGGMYLSADLDSHGRPLYYNYIKDNSRFRIVQAAVKNEIYDVKYDISGAQVRDAPPLIVLSTSVRNDSDVTVTQTLSYQYSKSETGTWNNTAGVTLGASATFKAGVPFIASVEWEISVSASYSHEWGGSVGTEKVVSESTSVTVPPHQKAQATIVVRNAQIDVGFSYREEILYANGEKEDLQKQGVYRNVDSYHVDVQLTNWEPTD